jgi:hypothetical protein
MLLCVMTKLKKKTRQNPKKNRSKPEHTNHPSKIKRKTTKRKSKSLNSTKELSVWEQSKK